MYLFFFCFPLCSPYLLLLIVSPSVNKTKVFSQPPVSLFCFTSCRSVNLCSFVASSLSCECSCDVYPRSCDSATNMHATFLSKRPHYIANHLYHVCLCFDFLPVHKEPFQNRTYCIQRMKPVCHLPVCHLPHPFFFTPLCITGCFVSPLSGSENHRNKLQGMMSDFPSKPAKPPSVSAQSRSGEGKTFLLTVIQTCIPDLPAITSKFSLMKPAWG